MSKRYPGGILRKTPQTTSQTSAQGVWDMASVTQAVKENNWPIAGVPDPISKSLRFRSSASAYLNRTPASAGTSNKTFTYSAWVKRGALGSVQNLISSPNTGNSDSLRFSAADALEYIWQDTALGQVTTTQVFRDPSAWYHIMFAMDTTQATAANRFKLYINGVQVTAFATASYPAQNTVVNNTAAVATKLGQYANSSAQSFDGYMTEVYLIDGQALTPSSFGSTNDQTGVWQPIAYTGTYGANGFYLPFSNTASTATLGYDFSGNSNNWTTNNISLTSGSTYDSMVDVPTQWIPYNTAGDTGALFRGNYCTLNPLNIVSPSTISAGNLNFDTGTTGGGGVYANWNYPESGKFYHELSNLSGVGTANGRASAANVYWESNTGDVYISSVFAANVGTWSDTSILGFAADCGAKTIALYRNNVLLYTASAGNAMFSSPVAYAADGSGSFAISGSFNFGQRPFAYTPPTGFRTLCTTNLTTPTIGATASTQAGKYFNPILYTGNGSSQTVTGFGFNPDMVWHKGRSVAYNHSIVDVIRGNSNVIFTNTTDAESNPGAQLALATDGATVTYRAANLANNQNAATYVIWGWKANGAGVSNTAGSITSTVSANTTAGFSVVTYTGNGTSSQTCGHGLGVTPSMVIWKNRNDVDSWIVYHNALTTSEYLVLNTTAAKATVSGLFTGISSTLLPLNNVSAAINANGFNYVAYCFAQVAGYSAFGSYTGNGSNDGPFTYTGFRPRFVMWKRTDASSGNGWYVLDSARSTTNVMGERLFPNLSNAGSVDTQVDFLSNGFKLRTTDTDSNASGGTYIYMAFAESPFKYALAR